MTEKHVIPLELVPSGPKTAADAKGVCQMRHFHLLRSEDPTGVSGTGRVAEGVVFSNGWVAMTWLSAQPSISFYTSLEQVEAIHGHNGTTRIVFHATECDEPAVPRAEARDDAAANR